MLAALFLEQGGIYTVRKTFEVPTGLVKQAELSVKSRW
jgi:hypothetical protein